MSSQKFVAYLRVSTSKQEKSGHGLHAQRAAVSQYLNSQPSATLVREVIETESGRRNDRPKLAEALSLCKMTGAILVISKLDRLGRNASFLLNLQQSQVSFVCCDNPHANPLTIGLLAVISQHEAEMISRRTKEALAAARRRGVRLGARCWDHLVKFGGNEAAADACKSKADTRARDLKPIIDEIRSSGKTSLNAIAKELSQRGILAANGSTRWYARTVSNVLARLS